MHFPPSPMSKTIRDVGTHPVPTAFSQDTIKITAALAHHVIDTTPSARVNDTFPEHWRALDKGVGEGICLLAGGGALHRDLYRSPPPTEQCPLESSQHVFGRQPAGPPPSRGSLRNVLTLTVTGQSWGTSFFFFLESVASEQGGGGTPPPPP